MKWRIIFPRIFAYFLVFNPEAMKGNAKSKSSEAFEKECLRRKVIEVENLKNKFSEAFHPHLYSSYRSIKTN